MNISAVITFFLFLVATLFITRWAARQTNSAHDFYAAGERISGTQNGLAIAGDIMSASALLGTTGLVFAIGYDSLYFIIGPILGFTIIMLLIVEPLRNLGRYSFTDVLAYRLDRRSVRIFAACTTLIVNIAYLVAQIVGAGVLIGSLFQLPFTFAVILVGALMMLYVSFGGMLATTWVQITKAVLLLVGTSILVLGVLYRFDFSIADLAREAVAHHPRGENMMKPGALLSDPVSIASLMIAFILGTAGLPHVLMRFFTVPDVKAARHSVVVSTACMAFFASLVFFVGLGAVALLHGQPEYFGEDGRLLGGSNMAIIHLSELVGGSVFLGFISAVAFATILAVVSGLTISAVSAVSHDLYANVFRYQRSSPEQELRVARISTFIIGFLAIALSMLARNHNLTILATLAMAIAASATFPVLILSIHWRGLTTHGALVAGYLGLFSSVILVVLGPLVWVDMLGFDSPVFPYYYPTLFSVTASFIAAWLFSVTDSSDRASGERAAFDIQHVHAETGIICKPQT